MIKTFRGTITSGSQDTVVLHTNDGTIGYRIVKFQIIPGSWGAVTQEVTVKIHTVANKTADFLIDFNDQTLLGVACLSLNASGNIAGDEPVIIFDKMIFNQDIYLVAKMDSAAPDVNYYLELEKVKLDLNENTVATLKDIRNIEQPPQL